MLRTTTNEDFKRAFNQICSLCGYPAVKDDKIEVFINFLRYNHGTDTIDDLINAFNALAAGRLDEKMDSFKSLTGLSASRVLSAYKRLNTKSNPIEEDPRSRMTDENMELIFNRTGRKVYFNDDLNQDEKDYLMEYWMKENEKLYLASGRANGITATSFDYLINKGEIRKENDMLQIRRNGQFIDLCYWSEIERGGKTLKKEEDVILASIKVSPIRRAAGKSVNEEDAIKRYAVMMYYTNK